MLISFIVLALLYVMSTSSTIYAADYKYNENGELIEEILSENSILYYKYDRNGNLINKTKYSNVARNKPATAQGYAGSNLPSRANDADSTNSSYWGVELNNSSAWWQVDLEGIYELNKIVIRNYVDGNRYYHYRVDFSVDGFNWIEAGNKNDTLAATNKGDQYNTASVNARYVRVTMTHNSANIGVHLSDVRVYGVKSSLALNKPATAEGYFGSNLPSKANDADSTNNSYWGVDLTKSSTWWQVDLEAIYELNKIVIRNYVHDNRYYHYRVDVSSDGLNWVEVGNKKDSSIATENGDQYSFPSVYARFVKVTMTHNSANPGVHLSDVRVYGDKASLALNKLAIASGYLGNNLPSRANDLDPTNNSYWGMELENSSTWWQVDLGKIYKLNKIVIRNYVHESRYYHYMIEISADGSNWSQVGSKENSVAASDRGDQYYLSPVNARYVKVIMTHNSANSGVHLSDVRVYGDAM